MLYLVGGYFLLFFILRNCINKMNGTVKSKGRIYDLKSGPKGVCSYGKSKICTADGITPCTGCYMNNEISKKQLVGKKVVLGLYISQILAGSIFLVSFI